MFYRENELTWDNTILKERGLVTTGFHLPYNPGLVSLARQMRNAPTESEKKIWSGLLKKFKYPVLRQRPIDNFIVDFYCAKLKLVIEIDGAAHFTEEGKTADREKEQVLNGYGLKVIHISDHEVTNHFSVVCRDILKYL